MNNYEHFKKAVSARERKNYQDLRKEVKTVEFAIEKFLSSALECTSTMAEKDFFVSAL